MSEHFQRHEFACPHCGVIKVVPELTRRLERLRWIIGERPIEIVSGYRCAIHNRAVGGAPNSQHLYGRAADIPPGLATYENALRSGFMGIGTSGEWAIHVDVRPPPPAHWTY